MSEELQQKLRDQLWEVANKLRGNMSASDFMYFTLGFIFYKYLSEKIEKHANDALVDDEVTFKELWAMEKDEDIEELQEVVKTECLENIGYFIEPNFLFSSVIESIKRKENILPMLERSLKRIEDSTLGQEKNPTTYNLARMNMLLHGIKFSNFRIENGDTLEADAFGDTQFDAVVANPPFSAEWSAADKFNNDDRFSKAGRLAPRKTADYAFILHMIYHLNEGGTMACVAPHGVLFRGNAEGVIRRFLIEKKNYVDAIIGLPANIFYGTSIPTCILVFKKCRKEDDNILFIDASKEFEKVKTQNKLRPQHIKKIIDTYRERKEIEKYSHLATLQEVAENDYNLNIPRYVDTFEEEEPVDIHAVMKEIKDLEAKRADLDKEIEGYLKELGLVE